MAAAIALTIAGSDSGGGAGVQADLKTFSALGVFGASVIAALTAQNTQAVTGILDVPAEFVAKQISAVFDDLTVDAVKIGMLSRPDVIEAVAEGLRRYKPRHVVLDPVMVAKSGDALLQAEAVGTLKQHLLPLATVITPNLPEAAVLLGRDDDIGFDAFEETGRALLDLGPSAVLLKGGHLESAQSPDLLVQGGGVTLFEGERIDTANTHGTGCTLSSAIAALLARGKGLEDAVRGAKAYITEAVRRADELEIGSGHGPVHHFHEFWSNQESGS